ncbi:MAG: bifunctional metallophosphatase/5'-nucleotidase [Chrysiogenales bacterium]|nr:MAG: bifunctional metallophosphatase/5'-nucleotidase [Chrysiogenales bacterium]
MKRIARLLCIVLTILPLAVHAGEQKLTFIHTNDLHSYFLGIAPGIDYTPQVTGDDGTKGGWARIMTVIKNVKAERTGPVLLLDGGDFLMGSLFHMVSRERALELRLLHKMGYDVATLGNHEFDLRPSGLARILNSARDAGTLPHIVSSNVIFSTESGKDDTLEAAFRAGLVRPYTVIEKQGVKIGFFGLIGKEAAEVAPFAKPVTFEDPVIAARRMVATLRNDEKVDVIVCLSHSGLKLNDLSSSEDVLLAREVPGIDIIISGHTHTPLEKPIVEGSTIIVQAWCYGRWVGVLDVSLKDGRTSMDGYRIQVIDDSIPGDPAITAAVEGYKAEVSGRVLAPMGLAFDSIIAHTPFDLTIGVEESNLGNLIADASRSYVNRFVHDPGDPDSKVVAAIDSNGLIRESVLRGKTGRVSVSDLFNALPLGIGVDDTMGYPMITMYLNASELKKGLEILTSVYPLKNEDYFLQISGLRFTYNPRRMFFDRVTGIEIGSEEEGYEVLDYSTSNDKLYRVAANIYNATFLKIVGNFTMNILTIVPKDRQGNPINDLAEALVDADPNRPGIQEAKQWVGLLQYVRGFKDITGDGLPDIPEKYRGKLGRIVMEPSLNPVSLLRRGTRVTWLAFGIFLAVAGGIGFAGFIVTKRLRKK